MKITKIEVAKIKELLYEFWGRKESYYLKIHSNQELVALTRFYEFLLTRFPKNGSANSGKSDNF